jgi:hypothetical protein
VVVQQVSHALGDEVADLAHLIQRAASRVGNIAVIDASGHVRAHVAAAHGHRPVGVQLHLDREALGLQTRQVNTDLAHHLDDLGPHLRGRIRPRRLGATVMSAVAFKERLRHLGAPGVVGADKQHVLHDTASSYAAATSLSAYSVGSPAAATSRATPSAS